MHMKMQRHHQAPKPKPLPHAWGKCTTESAARGWAARFRHAAGFPRRGSRCEDEDELDAWVHCRAGGASPPPKHQRHQGGLHPDPPLITSTPRIHPIEGVSCHTQITQNLATKSQSTIALDTSYNLKPVQTHSPKRIENG